MYRIAQVFALCSVLAMVLLTGGCSGPGVAVNAIQQADLRALAADHVSAVLLLKGWLRIMYVKNAPGGGECEQQINRQRLPGGVVHLWGTMSDCTQFDYTVQADGSGVGLLVWPDGGVEELTWTPPVWNGLVHTVDIDRVLPDGTRLDFSNTADFGQAGTPSSMVGEVTLADGRSMDFALHRLTMGDDRLRLQMPDGSVLDATIPTTAVEYAVHWPIFSPGGSGWFSGAAGDRLDFTFSGESEGWDRWVATAADGTRGEFELGEGLAGNGNLTRNGQVLGALRWFVDGLGTLDLLDAGSAEVAPSAAARDFQIDRWVSNIAAMGPAPMY